MSSPYLQRLRPAVGGGLGGLPVRFSAPAAYSNDWREWGILPTNGSKSLSHSAQGTGAVSDMSWNSDGTKLVLVISTSAFQYSCPTPWDLTSAVYDTSAALGSQDIAPLGITFNQDGTKFYMVGNSSNTVYQYSCPTPGSVSGMTYDSISKSISSQTTNPRGMCVSTDGAQLYFTSAGQNKVFQYTLVPDDVSTLNYTNTFLSIPNQGKGSVQFNDIGTEFYVFGLNTIMQFTLSVPFDLGSAVDVGVNFPAPSGTPNLGNMSAFAINREDGSTIMLVGTAADFIYQYDVTPGAF